MTRCVCFQPDRLSCRIEKVSAKDGEMDGRNTNRPVRYHGRIGFTSHERELLKFMAHVATTHHGTVLVQGKTTYTFTLADGRQVKGAALIHDKEWP